MSTASPELAHKMWRTLEPYHGIIYFTPHAPVVYAELGIEGRDGYFASRAAPLGPVSAEVVIATFYNFFPGLVRHAIPAVWEKASPADILAARLAAADLALREILGDAVDGNEVAQAAVLAERVARAASLAGRPLFAAHAALPWPDPPHLALWHAISLLREFRGDGHIAALVTACLDPCEALITPRRRERRRDRALGAPVVACVARCRVGGGQGSPDRAGALRRRRSHRSGPRVAPADRGRDRPGGRRTVVGHASEDAERLRAIVRPGHGRS